MTDTSSFYQGAIEVKPKSTVPLREIVVSVSAQGLIKKIADFLPYRAQVEDILKAEQVHLEEADIAEYLNYLVTKRVALVTNPAGISVRALSQLYIPGGLLDALKRICVLVDEQQNIRYIPKMDKPSKLTDSQALEISNKIQPFASNWKWERRSFPRELESFGLALATAHIADHIRAIRLDITQEDILASTLLNVTIPEDPRYDFAYSQEYDYYEDVYNGLWAKRFEF